MLGAIAARYWDRNFAECALGPFERICSLFQEAANTSLQPFRALVRIDFSRTC